MCQCGQVDGGTGVEADVGVAQQVVHAGVGQDVGMGALEVQDFQVGVGGLFFHQVDLPEEVGGYFIDAVRHSLVVGRGLVDVHRQRG